jgi:hypothetical protein
MLLAHLPNDLVKHAYQSITRIQRPVAPHWLQQLVGITQQFAQQPGELRKQLVHLQQQWFGCRHNTC